MICILKYSGRFVHDQVRAGRDSTEDQVLSDALEQLRKHAQAIATSQGSLGAVRDGARAIDEVVEHAMQLRSQPFTSLPSRRSVSRHE
jgi:hypothetical protein